MCDYVILGFTCAAHYAYNRLAHRKRMKKKHARSPFVSSVSHEFTNL